MVRPATGADVAAMKRIYNQGIEDGVATLEVATRSEAEMAAWYADRDERHAVLVAVAADEIVGWASLNRFSHRCAHDAIADLSVYVARERRSQGIGRELLLALLERARDARFHKVVLHALDSNVAGKRLYARVGFVEVGVFKEHGEIDGSLVDVVAMEQILR
ncbi:MAG: arsinothricin resistance N-acetyltransferase ArsN1 family A [Vulcanimicrobiaceae bacterium]